MQRPPHLPCISPTSPLYLAHISQARGGAMQRDAAVAALHAQDFLRGDAGRYWVAISLREAETVRAAMHVARDGF